MLIEIHIIQNHSPSNLNRDDLGAPKTCFFGGALRQRISSQCLKRAIRMSDIFAPLRGGIRTRRLATVLARLVQANEFGPTPARLSEIADSKRVLTSEETKLEEIGRLALEHGGVAPKSKKQSGSAKNTAGGGEDTDTAVSKMLLFLSSSTIGEMARDLAEERDPKRLAERFKAYIAKEPAVPDVALNGRMTEVGKDGLFSELNFTVDASLQAAHAFSTHEARPEVDYYVAADDIPGNDAGAGFLDEAQFASACFYKYFSIHWESLVENLKGNKELAAATLGAFILAAAQKTPSGKQNSYAANNEACGILIEIKKNSDPATSYANAFAEPVERSGKWKKEDGADNASVEGRSVACLNHHVANLRRAYESESTLLWYSPDLARFPMPVVDPKCAFGVLQGKDGNGLVAQAVQEATGLKWGEVQAVTTSAGKQ